MRWLALIVYDGVAPSHNHSDKRIRHFVVPKIGRANHAAVLRNFGSYQTHTPWVAFVDDDDTLDPSYVARLQEEIALTPEAKCVIFRMHASGSGALPPASHTDFKVNSVGISFAVRRTLFDEGLMFAPSATEDYELLARIRDAKKRIVMSPYVTYLVKASACMPEFHANRTIIN
jgi:hypothetical protein